MNPEHNHLHDESGYAVEYVILGMASKDTTRQPEDEHIIFSCSWTEHNLNLPGQ